MKSFFLFVLQLLIAAHLQGQSGNPNTMSVMVEGKAYTTEPRRITIGAYSYITGNAINPDKSLRIWLGTYDGREIAEPGRYLIVGDDGYKKDDGVEKAWMTGEYKGIAFVRYIEETKSPRMEYHMGESMFSGQAIEVTKSDDGYFHMAFDADLAGSWWKESTSATVFGGIGRLTDKMADKAVTGATGYDQDIDPEGRGYKKQKTTDSVKLTECRIRLKLN